MEYLIKELSNLKSYEEQIYTDHISSMVPNKFLTVMEIF